MLTRLFYSIDMLTAQRRRPENNSRWRSDRSDYRETSHRSGARLVCILFGRLYLIYIHDAVLAANVRSGEPPQDSGRSVDVQYLGSQLDFSPQVGRQISCFSIFTLQRFNWFTTHICFQYVDTGSKSKRLRVMSSPRAIVGVNVEIPVPAEKHSCSSKLYVFAFNHGMSI